MARLTENRTTTTTTTDDGRRRATGDGRHSLDLRQRVCVRNKERDLCEIDFCFLVSERGIKRRGGNRGEDFGLLKALP